MGRCAFVVAAGLSARAVFRCVHGVSYLPPASGRWAGSPVLVWRRCRVDLRRSAGKAEERRRGTLSPTALANGDEAKTTSQPHVVEGGSSTAENRASVLDGKGDARGATESTEENSRKHYSTRVTIVSGCDPTLCRGVIENIVSSLRDRKVVVVTTGKLPPRKETEEDQANGPAIDQEVLNVREQGMQAEDMQAEDMQGSEKNEISIPINGLAAKESRESADIMSDGVSSTAAVSSGFGGWLSCASHDEMAQVVSKLAASREVDYVVVEGPVDNSVEPQTMANMIRSRGGGSVGVDALISVVDGQRVLRDLRAERSSTSSDANDDRGEVSNVRAPVADNSRAMTIVSLVENADVVVVSRRGSQDRQDSGPINSLISTLNLNATIVEMTDNEIPVSQLVDTNLYSPDNSLRNPTWRRVLMADRGSEGANGTGRAPSRNLPKSLKEATFVYRAKRPFHPTRLYDHIKDVATFTGVIRSRGKLWLATRMRAPLEWNQAGDSATLRSSKPFWAAVPEDSWPPEDSEREAIMNRWDNQFGDRETEIVFVGTGIEKTKLQGLLDGCLLQDEEMAFQREWESFEDPFVEWVPLVEEEEEEEHPIRVIAATDSESDVEKMVEVAAASSEEVGSTLREGEVDVESLDQAVMEKIPSALDTFDCNSTYGGRELGRDDDGEFDDSDVIIASWDTDEARGILEKIPQVGLPVTIVTGFLGSGKTTLLNYILKADHGLKIAVLVNEFGEIDIDNQLVERGDWGKDDEIMELANGCICCSINESFVSAVEKILERKDAVNYLVVETTGVADPFPIINSMFTPTLDGLVRIDGIVTMVDVLNFDLDTFGSSEAAQAQIYAADTILLSKTDIASKEKLDLTVQHIRKLRPEARLLKALRGRVPLDLILDVGVRVSKRKKAVETAEVEDSPAEQKGEHEDSHEHDHELEDDHDHDHDHDHNHDHSNHSHLEADGFVAASFKSDLAFDTEKFKSEFMEKLPQGVFRAKGLLHFDGYPHRYIFQLSGRRFEIDQDEWPEGIAPGCQMVVIGRDLNIDELRGMLESCQVPNKYL